MGIRKRTAAAKAQLDAVPEEDVAARHIAEGILNLEKWRNVDALDCFQKALDTLKSK